MSRSPTDSWAIEIGADTGETEGVVVVPVRQHHPRQGHRRHRRNLRPQRPALLGRGAAVDQHRRLGADHQPTVTSAGPSSAGNGTSETYTCSATAVNGPGGWVM